MLVIPKESTFDNRNTITFPKICLAISNDVILFESWSRITNENSPKTCVQCNFAASSVLAVIIFRRSGDEVRAPYIYRTGMWRVKIQSSDRYMRNTQLHMLLYHLADILTCHQHHDILTGNERSQYVYVAVFAFLSTQWLITW